MTDRKRTLRRILRVGVIVLAAAFLGLGIARAEQAEVFQRAVRICLECIGIG